MHPSQVKFNETLQTLTSRDVEEITNLASPSKIESIVKPMVAKKDKKFYYIFVVIVVLIFAIVAIIVYIKCSSIKAQKNLAYEMQGLRLRDNRME